MVTETRLNKIKNVVSNRQKDIVVVLEDTYDPHNAEAVFRSCDAFGVKHLHLIFINQKTFNPKKIGKSSSSSANKWLDFTIHNSTEECLTTLKKDGYTIFATTLENDSKSIYDTNFTASKKVAILLGNEHSGLTQKAIELSDEKVIIPMCGMVQSFNLSVTASIFLYEVYRQRHPNIKSHLLSQEKQKKLVTDYILR
jgi:tRNA (guanosine-2'-O-)-methyltransferase